MMQMKILFMIGVHQLPNFYNNMIGPSSYTVRQNKIDTVIKERRQFLLERDRLVKFLIRL